MTETIEVVIPTRDRPIRECYWGLREQTPLISTVTVVKDDGRGQTRIRYEGALASKADFVLLLDDDVEMRSGVVKAYLDKIREGFDAVCGETNPKPQNRFSERVARYMTNPSTPFYPVGCTLWRRKKFIQIMEEVGLGIHKHLGDVTLEKRINAGGYNVVKVPTAVSDHYWATSPSKFFKKRLGYGVAIGEMYYGEGRLGRQLVKWAGAIPLSTGYGMFLYRLATWIGMVKFAVDLYALKNETV